MNPSSYHSQPTNLQSESIARQSRVGLGGNGYSHSHSGVANFPAGTNLHNNSTNATSSNMPNQAPVSHSSGGLVFATGAVEQQQNYHNDGSYRENLQQHPYPKRYPSAAPPAQSSGASLSRSNTITGGSYQNHNHQSDTHPTYSMEQNQTSGYGRRRVPSVESFRTGAINSPYMGSQAGGPPRAPHYAASEYTPSTMPRERYVRSNDLYGRTNPDYGRPNESYNSSYRNPPVTNYESAAQKLNNSYDRPQSRFPVAGSGYQPSVPISEAGYRQSSTYPSHSNTTPYSQNNASYNPPGNSNNSYNNVNTYNGPQMNDNSRMDHRRPDSRISYIDSNRVHADQNLYNQRGFQQQYQPEPPSSAGYRPSSAARTDYDGYNNYLQQQQSQIIPQQQPQMVSQQQPQMVSQQEPRVYKSRSTMSIKGAVSAKSPSLQNPSTFTRKGSLEEKQALPDSFRTQSKKMENLLGHARNPSNNASKGGHGDVNNVEMLNLQGLEVTDPLSPPPQSLQPHPQSLKDLYSLSREIASLVLNRQTPLSREEWSLLLQKVNHQVAIVDEIDK